jgi:hypothetical protein
MDFVTDLPLSEGFDARFTKIAQFFPCVKSITSQATTEFIMREVF